MDDELIEKVARDIQGRMLSRKLSHGHIEQAVIWNDAKEAARAAIQAVREAGWLPQKEIQELLSDARQEGRSRGWDDAWDAAVIGGL